MVTYTDGVTEIENEKEEQYGTRKLARTLKKNLDKEMDDMLRNVFQSIEKHRGKNELCR